jgi:hypothetical protein
MSTYESGGASKTGEPMIYTQEEFIQEVIKAIYVFLTEFVKPACILNSTDAVIGADEEAVKVLTRMVIIEQLTNYGIHPVNGDDMWKAIDFDMISEYLRVSIHETFEGDYVTIKKRPDVNGNFVACNGVQTIFGKIVTYWNNQENFLIKWEMK